MMMDWLGWKSRHVHAVFFLLLSSTMSHIQAQDSYSGDVELSFPFDSPIECNAKADIVFILDSSSSVGVPNFRKVLEFVVGMLYSSNINGGDVRVGVMTFSTEVFVSFYLGAHSTKRDVTRAILNIPYIYGSTNTADGLHTLRTEMFNPANGDRDRVPNVAIVITDGISNLNSERTIPEALMTHAAGIHIFVVGIGLTGDKPEIRALATAPAEDNRFLVANFDDLKNIRRNVFSTLCEMVVIEGPLAATKSPLPSLPARKACSSEADVVFLLDSSSSVGEQNFQRLLRFLGNVIQDMAIDTGHFRVGVASYSSDIQVHFNLNDLKTREALLEAIQQIPYNYGSSNVADGLKIVRNQMFRSKNGDRPKANNVLVIITDGTPNVNVRRTLQEATKVKEGGVSVMLVGIGLGGNTKINDLVSEPAKPNTILVKKFQQLQSIRRKTFNAVCKAASSKPAPPPTGNSVAPSQEAKVTIKNCSGQGDIVFLIDSSGSVGKENFARLLAFVHEFVKPLNIDSGRYRVGLLVFSDDANVIFHLNKFKSTTDVLDAIAATKYVYGSTNTAAALNEMRTHMFTEDNGDRPDVPNVVVFITDGISNINNDQTMPEARQVHSAGIGVVAIGIGLSDTREVTGIGSKPANKFVHIVEYFEELDSITNKILKPLCADSNKCENNPCKNGGKCINALDHYICECKKGFTGPSCEQSCR
jgi:collagen type VI alpha